MVANCIFESPSNAQSRLRQQLAVRRERRVAAPKGERREATQAMSTAERRAKAHLRDQRFFSSKAGSNCISFLTRTKANHRPSPRKVTALKIHPNTKYPTAKRAACSTGRTVSDEIQQLQTTTRHLISPREIKRNESRKPQRSISSYGRAIAEIPHQKTC